MVKKKFQHKTGFTLVESLVAITVFLVVVTSVSSIYVSFVRQERKLYDFLKTENNIRFALDYMGRDIRMAKSYDFQNNFTMTGAAESAKELTFDDYTSTDTVRHEVEYRYDDHLHQITVSRDHGTPLSILDPGITVNYARFYISDGVKGTNQPTVIIVLDATDKNGNHYNLQTAVTPRNLNFAS